MGLKHHTIILVPHSRARFRKWRVSSRQVRILTVALGALSLAIGYLTWTHFTTNVDLEELQRLRAENSDLRQVNDQFEVSVRTLQQQLTGFEDQTNSLAIVAGLGEAVDSLSTRAATGAGAGGDLSAAPDAATHLRLLRERGSQLEGRLGDIGDQLQQRRLWISAQPAITPVQGIFTSFYGMRADPVTKRRAFHEGVDISAVPGTPVHAAADGVVVRASRIGSLGRAIYISHGFGLTTRYGHLASIQVRPGQRVKQNDPIGAVGNSGRSTGYHLHYEVRVDGKVRDPLEYILDLR